MAKKMILVDPATINYPNSFQLPDGLKSSVSALDKEMQNILMDTSNDIYTKALRYQQALQRYLKLSEKAQSRPLGHVEINRTDSETRDQTTDQETTQDLKENIIRSVPKNLRSKASLLTDFIEGLPSIEFDSKF